VVGLTSWGGIFTWTGTGWDRIPGYLSQVSVGQDGMWGITGWGGIFYRPSVADDGTPWERMPGYLAHVAAGPGERAWGIADWGGVFHYDSGSWTRVPGHLAQVDASTDCAWGVNGSGQVFRRMGVCGAHPDGTSWEQVSDPAVPGDERVQVAVGLPASAASTDSAIANTAPVADAGPAFSVLPGQEFTLSGLGSTDEDGEIVLYEWDIDGDGVFESKGAEVHVVLWDEGDHEVCLRVTDDDGDTATDSCTVTAITSE
jgi:hypothetical protein